MNVRIYEVRDRDTGKVLHCGTARECADKMGISVNRFYIVANEAHSYKYKNCYSALYRISQVPGAIAKLNENTRGALDRIGEQSHGEV